MLTWRDTDRGTNRHMETHRHTDMHETDRLKDPQTHLHTVRERERQKDIKTD